VITYFLSQKPSTSNGKVENELARPLLIYTEPVQAGLLIDQYFKINYEVDGGESPYSIVVDWGDGAPVTLLSHDKAGDYSANHTYKNPGQRTIRISGMDAKGSKATIQTIVVVHSSNAPVAHISNSCQGGSFSEYCFASDDVTSVIEYVWPAIAIATLMASSFWLGEKITYGHTIPRRKVAK
ncbi:MAG: PKD domain-containing protein, partial [Patescibacteria group bacterium]